MMMMSTGCCACLATMLTGVFAGGDASGGVGRPPPPPPAIQFDDTLDDYAVHISVTHELSRRCAALSPDTLNVVHTI